MVPRRERAQSEEQGPRQRPGLGRWPAVVWQPMQRDGEVWTAVSVACDSCDRDGCRSR